MEQGTVRGGAIRSDDSKELLAQVISNALADRDHDAAVRLLRLEADSEGMSALAREAGLDRVNLYRMLGSRGNPKLSVLIRILDALGYKLSVGLKN